MRNTYRIAALLGGAAMLIAALPVARSAGLWPTLPVVGGTSFCASTVTGTGNLGGVTGTGQGTTGSICGQTVPAGPAYTGEELLLSDVGGANGGTPTQNAVIPSSILGSVNAKANRLRCGDFGTCLWQFGTTPLSAASPTTYQMSADGWFAISASNVMTITKQTPISSAADYLGASGLYSWMRVARPSGTPTGTSCVGQILDQKAASALIGNNGVFSFYGYAPTTFSATASQVQVSVAYYTAADSTTSGVNTATFALSASGQAGGIAGYVAATAGTSLNTAGTLASGVETISLSTTPTRYAVYAPIPVNNASGTPVIGVGVSICATPTATTSVTTDYFEIEGLQLQALPSTVTPALPAGVVSPTGFERIAPALEAEREYYYENPAGLGTEVATAFYQAGICKASGNANFPLTFNPPLRLIPTTGTSTLTAGGYSIETAAAVTAIGTITVVGASTTGATLNSNAACTTTLPYAIVGSATTGRILLSAEP